MKENNKVTIYDIAKEAGVAPGTVSRAINNSGYVNEKTRQNINRAVKKLDYTPSRAARALKTKQTGLILLAIPDTSNPFYVKLIESFLEVMAKSGYSLILYYTKGEAQEEVRAVKMLSEDLADGLFLVNFSYDKGLFDEINNIQKPIVLCGLCNCNIGGGVNDKFDFVTINAKNALYLSTRELIRNGHKRIGLAAGDKELKVFYERFLGYKQALEEAGLEYDPELIFWEHDIHYNGYAAGEYFLSLENPPSAICTVNDVLALGIFSKYKEVGKRIPEDVALFGLDDLDSTKLLDLSTITMRQDEIGILAAERIIARINKKNKLKSTRTVLEPELVLRKSHIKFQ